LILLLLDACRGLTAQDEAIFAGLPADIPRLLVFNKIDLMKDKTLLMAGNNPFVGVSAKTGEGLEELRGSYSSQQFYFETGSGAIFT